jgi:uncharacterized Rmd1/YagE family protein
MSEADLLFPDHDRIKVKAILAAERIDLRSIQSMPRLSMTPVVLKSGDHGYAVLFRYGAIVLFGLDPLEEVALLNQARSLLSGPFEKPQLEEAEIGLQGEQPDMVDQGIIVLKEFSLQRIQVVADILAKSVVLAHYEERISQSFDRIEPLADALKRGKSYHRSKTLLHYIGDTLLTQQTMAGRVEVTDKPELLWERPELERLFLRLENEYEISERHLALERKLGLISQTLETLLDLLQNRRTIRVEWYILLLILVEILLTLYKMIVGG